MNKSHILPLTILLFGVILTPCYSQVRMGITADRKSYLQFEPIEITVVIENNSGNTLTFNNPDTKKPLENYIRCIIRDEQNERVRETTDSIKRFGKDNVNMATGFVLPAGGKRSLKVRINRYYDMSKSQSYSIQVKLRHKRIGKDLFSEYANVSVVNGVTVITQRFGLPTKVTDGEVPVIKERTCELISFLEARNNYYALRISDDDYIYCTHRLSRHSAADKPLIMIDARSHIHVLIHTQPKIFTYWLFDHQGESRQSSMYRYVKRLPVPKLHKDPDIGRVIVVGGERYIPEEDEEIELPEYKLAPSNE